MLTRRLLVHVSLLKITFPVFQESKDNLAALEWSADSSCFHFELNEKKGVSHLGLPFNPSVLSRTVNILFSSPSNCSDSGGITSSAG